MANIRVLTLALGLGAAFGLSAHALAEETYIPLISKGFQHQFWQAVKQGAEQAGKDLKVKVSFEGPETEAVVTGMSLSTPESNATTGIFAACAFFSSGIAALLSSAAKPIAAGFLASAAESMSICLSTMASVSGPSKVTLTFKSLPACSAPCFTACQNWCWKPLDTSGM